MADIFVVVYDPGATRASPVKVSASYYWNGDLIATSVPTAQEAEPHFLGRFSATPHRLLARLRQNSETPPPVVETNTHWIGRFTTAKHRIAVSVRQNQAADAAAAIVQPETNTNWIGRFTAPKFANPLLLRQNPANDVSLYDGAAGTFVVAYDNQWLSLATAWRRLYQAPANDVPANEANPHFVGRFKQTTHVISPFLRQHGDFEPPAVETNPHSIGRYQAQPFANLLSLRQNPAYDLPPPQPETNTNFIGKFFPTTYLNPLGPRQNPAYDVPVVIVQPETNNNFIGRFSPTAHRNTIQLRQAPALDKPPIQAETNTNWIGRFRPGTHTIPPGLYWIQSADGPPAPPPPPVVVPTGGGGKRRKPIRPIWVIEREREAAAKAEAEARAAEEAAGSGDLAPEPAPAGTPQKATGPWDSAQIAPAAKLGTEQAAKRSLERHLRGQIAEEDDKLDALATILAKAAALLEDVDHTEGRAGVFESWEQRMRNNEAAIAALMMDSEY